MKISSHFSHRKLGWGQALTPLFAISLRTRCSSNTSRRLWSVCHRERPCIFYLPLYFICVPELWLSSAWPDSWQWGSAEWLYKAPEASVHHLLLQKSQWDKHQDWNHIDAISNSPQLFLKCLSKLQSSIFKASVITQYLVSLFKRNWQCIKKP